MALDEPETRQARQEFMPPPPDRIPVAMETEEDEGGLCLWFCRGCKKTVRPDAPPSCTPPSTLTTTLGYHGGQKGIGWVASSMSSPALEESPSLARSLSINTLSTLATILSSPSLAPSSQLPPSAFGALPLPLSPSGAGSFSLVNLEELAMPAGDVTKSGSFPSLPGLPVDMMSQELLESQIGNLLPVA